MEWMFQEKSAPHQNDRYHPGNRENDKKNFQRRCPGKYSKDPCNPKQAGADHGQNGWKRGMAYSAQESSRNFVKSADRFKEKNPHDADTCSSDGSKTVHGCLHENICKTKDCTLDRGRDADG